MTNYNLRAMAPDDWDAVSALIFSSTNAWYARKFGVTAFGGVPDDCRVFCRTYEALDPGCCLVAVDDESGAITGSCFWHPRSTHVSIGIVNVDPERFGKGIAGGLLRAAIREADARGLPMRLVSSAMNLDSFSLYTRLGFVPRAIFHDMVIPVPADGFRPNDLPEELRARVRPATAADVPKMASLERELVGIERAKDYDYFVENRDRIWSAHVFEGETGAIDGFLCGVDCPASRMLGPGVARADDIMAALIASVLDTRRGTTPLFLAPADRPELIAQLYRWGARNVELHVGQIRGDWRPPTGVILPTFLPETG